MTVQMEELLTAKIESCLLNEYFAKIEIDDRTITLDKAKSKCIVSTINKRELEASAYQNGESITSSKMSVDFIRKTGTYYVMREIMKWKNYHFDFLS